MDFDVSLFLADLSRAFANRDWSVIESIIQAVEEFLQYVPTGDGEISSGDDLDTTEDSEEDEGAG